MTEKEKMIIGKLYDSSDYELTKLRQQAHKLSHKYNHVTTKLRKRYIFARSYPI